MGERIDPGDLLLRCVAAVAGADGRVEDIELDEISRIHREITGQDVPVDRIRSAVEAAWDQGGNAMTDIAAARWAVDYDARIRIATACYRVLASDGEITGTEARTFNALAVALGVSPEDLPDGS